jgi:hypothetical protein
MSRANATAIKSQGPGNWHLHGPTSCIAITANKKTPGMLGQKISHILPHHVPQMNEHIRPGHMLLIPPFHPVVRGVKMSIRNDSHTHGTNSSQYGSNKNKGHIIATHPLNAYSPGHGHIVKNEVHGSTQFSGHSAQ